MTTTLMCRPMCLREGDAFEEDLKSYRLVFPERGG